MSDVAQEHIDALAAQVYAARAESDALKSRLRSVRAICDQWQSESGGAVHPKGWLAAFRMQVDDLDLDAADPERSNR